MRKFLSWFRKLWFWVGGSIIRYEDFIIHLQPFGGDGPKSCYKVITHWKGDKVEELQQVNQSQQIWLDDIVEKLKKWQPSLNPTPPWGRNRRPGKENEDFGRKLREFIMPKTSAVWRQLEKALKEVEAKGKHLRLCLVIDRSIQPRELLILPWEYLYIEELKPTGFIALHPSISFIRQVSEDLIEKRKWLWFPFSRRKVRVLIVVSNPQGETKDPDGHWRPLDLDAELEAVCEALQGKLRPRGVYIEVLGVERLSALCQALRGRGIKVLPGRATIEKLREVLGKGHFDILHYMGHGFYLTPERRRALQKIPSHLPGKDGAGLVLEPKEGSPWSKENYLFVDEFLGMLKGSSIQLVMLSCCEQARAGFIQREEREELLAVARTLIEGDIPAVVAMQFEIPDASARCFATEFYSSFSRHKPIDACVSTARKLLENLVGTENFDWGAPVLYAAQIFTPVGIVINITLQFVLIISIIWGIGYSIWWGLTPDIRTIFGPMAAPFISTPLGFPGGLQENADLDWELRSDSDVGSYLRMNCELETMEMDWCQWGIQWNLLYYDASACELLRFQIRGARGGERFQVLFRGMLPGGKGTEAKGPKYEFPKGGARSLTRKDREYVEIVSPNTWVPAKIPFSSVQSGGVNLSANLIVLSIRVDSFGFDNQFVGPITFDITPVELEPRGCGALAIPGRRESNEISF